QLESLSSREERYKNDVTVDIAALVGARGGGQSVQRAGGGSDNDWLFGAFAPFGLQLGLGALGLAAYPLDIGSYLVADGKGAPTASAAVRFGGAIYARPSRDIPLVVGGGGDYRPEIGDEK